MNMYYVKAIEKERKNDWSTSFSLNTPSYFNVFLCALLVLAFIELLSIIF